MLCFFKCQHVADYVSPTLWSFFQLIPSNAGLAFLVPNNMPTADFRRKGPGAQQVLHKRMICNADKPKRISTMDVPLGFQCFRIRILLSGQGSLNGPGVISFLVVGQ